MSFLLITIITLQILTLALEVWRHYSASPAMFLRSQGPEFQAKVQQHMATRLHTINSSKVVGS